MRQQSSRYYVILLHLPIGYRVLAAQDADRLERNDASRIACVSRAADVGHLGLEALDPQVWHEGVLDYEKRRKLDCASTEGPQATKALSIQVQVLAIQLDAIPKLLKLLGLPKPTQYGGGTMDKDGVRTGYIHLIQAIAVPSSWLASPHHASSLSASDMACW
jgi:hypothetical protein